MIQIKPTTVADKISQHADNNQTEKGESPDGVPEC